MIADLEFPFRGIDVAVGFADQRPGTTAVGQNVMGFEPSTDRLRGGSRPGLSRFIDQQLPLNAQIGGLTYWHLVQHLNIVVRGAVGGLFGDPEDDDGGPGFIDDPSSPGHSTSWNTHTIVYDWNGNPVTSTTLNTRNPGPHRVRNHGSGHAPNPSSVTLAPVNGVTYLFQCIGEVLVESPGHPLDGTTPSFQGCACVGALYLTLAGAPTHAMQFAKWNSERELYFAQHLIPDGAWSFVESSNFVEGPLRECTAADISTSLCTTIYGGTAGTYPHS